jgi:hypothetical protein
MTLNERARERLGEEKDKKHVTIADLAAWCRWTGSKVHQKLLGRSAMTLDEFDTLCHALDIRPTEVLRDRGLEFCAEMTPTEMRELEQLRRLPRHAREMIQMYLRIEAREIEKRGLTDKSTKAKRNRITFDDAVFRDE